MRMGLEVLQSGDLKVRRDDAADLVAIRNGQMSYDELIEVAEALQLRMQTARKHSALPADVDPERVDRLFGELVRA
jgi:uncharacterized protein